jgi:hypothetical protein
MIELIAIVAVVVLTYLLLLVLGPRPVDIFISIKERERWAKIVSGRGGTLFYISNVVATLTSLATVYVFFIGSTKLFGYFIGVCLLSIVAAGWVTLRFTRRLLETELFATRLSQHEATTAAITSLFWSETTKPVSQLIKYVSQVAIACILWLEFATLAKLFGGLFGIESTRGVSIAYFLAVLFVFDFTFRNGLRGFLFADLLHFPLIFLGVIAFAVGTAFYAFTYVHTFNLDFLASPPTFPIAWCLLFAAATLFLNAFLLVTSEAHWLRVWTMGNKVRSATAVSLGTTGVVWAFLILVGLLVIGVTNNIGWEAVVDVVTLLRQQSVWFSVAFWVAAVAAIFSTADGQIYSFLVISAFDSKTGQLDQRPVIVRYPFYSALAVAAVFTLVFVLVEISQFPFEPIVFFLFPIFLCIVPAFVQLMRTGRVTTGPIIASIVLYAVCGIAMIALPEWRFPISLAAPLMPALVCVGIVATTRRVSTVKQSATAGSEHGVGA